MTTSRARRADVRGAFCSLALLVLLVWKPQILLALALYFAQLAQMLLAPAFSSLAH